MAIDILTKLFHLVKQHSVESLRNNNLNKSLFYDPLISLALMEQTNTPLKPFHCPNIHRLLLNQHLHQILQLHKTFALATVL